jgi:photosystem II stability/assembly factor-like uncharacterized protein
LAEDRRTWERMKGKLSLLSGVRIAAALSALVFLVLLCVPGGETASSSPKSSEAVLYSEGFERGNAAGWSLESGWEYYQDVQGDWMLHGQGHSWARYGGDSWGDYALALDVRLVKGRIHINFRVSGCTRYFIGLDAQGIDLSRTSPCGTHEKLKAAKATFKSDRWYKIRITGSGAKIEVSVDGTAKLSYTDSQPLLFGQIALETVEDSEAYVDDIEVVGAAVASTGLAWTRTGGPLGGMGYDIRMRPDNPDIMYVTDAWSGVSMSMDGGRVWSASNGGIITRIGPSGDAIPIFCLSLDPHNPDVMWAGTDGLRGIFKSADGGKSWVEMDRGIVEDNGITFRGFTVDPRTSKTVYAAAEIFSWVWAGKQRMGREFDLTQGVVYRTTDGGLRWNAIWRGDNLARYIWIDPRNPDTLYVSTGIFDREAANSNWPGAPGGVGVAKSVDGGKTWRTLGTLNGLRNLYVGSLFMHPDNPDILLAGAGNVTYGTGSGVYLSEDAGETWRQVLATGQSEPITSVEFSTLDPKIAYAGSSFSVYRSGDGGHTWQRTTPADQWGDPRWGPPGIRAGFPIDFQVDPRNADRLFANNYSGGNFLSEDGGRTWTVASQGYTGAQVHVVVVDRNDPDIVYAGARSGIFRSVNGGANWEALNYAPATMAEWYSVAVDPCDAEKLLISDEHSGKLFRSTDGGADWTVTFQCPGVGNANPNNRYGFKAIAIAPSAPETVYIGACRNRALVDEGRAGTGFGVFRSSDGGLTWQEANDSHTAAQNINALAVDPVDARVVYAATVGKGVFKSADGGGTWQPSNTGLHMLDIRVVAIDPKNPQVVYIGAEGGGIYRSTDGGLTWVSSSVGMDPQATVRALAIDPTNSKVLYAGDYRTGAYRSEDGGRTWSRMSVGLRTRAVTSLSISADGKSLYAGTNGEGVFRLDLKPTGG